MTEKPRYINTWIRPKMDALGDYVTKKKQTGTRIEKQKKGMFSRETVEVEVPIFEDVEEFVPNGKFAVNRLDYDDFSRKLDKATNNLHADGYDVISIMPITEGHWDLTFAGNSGAGWGFGYTRGVMITAKLRD